MMERVRKTHGKEGKEECDREQRQREGEMKERRNTGQETEGMKCALTVFRFKSFGTSLFPSQSLRSRNPQHLRDCHRIQAESRWLDCDSSV